MIVKLVKMFVLVAFDISESTNMVKLRML